VGGGEHGPAIKQQCSRGGLAAVADANNAIEALAGIGAIAAIEGVGVGGNHMMVEPAETKDWSSSLVDKSIQASI